MDLILNNNYDLNELPATEILNISMFNTYNLLYNQNQNNAIFNMLLEATMNNSVPQQFIDVVIPLPKNILATLPIVKYNNLMISKDCSICLENFTTNINVRLIKCNHAFHPKCIDKWFECNTKCPNCKYDNRY